MSHVSNLSTGGTSVTMQRRALFPFLLLLLSSVVVALPSLADAKWYKLSIKTADTESAGTKAKIRLSWLNKNGDKVWHCYIDGIGRNKWKTCKAEQSTPYGGSSMPHKGHLYINTYDGADDGLLVAEVTVFKENGDNGAAFSGAEYFWDCSGVTCKKKVGNRGLDRPANATGWEHETVWIKAADGECNFVSIKVRNLASEGKTRCVK